MTNHDRISSFIDNELSTEQEQDFLISLASSDGLRRSFRSELVLKNVIHRDEVLTEPSRDLRPAILGAIGIATVSAVTAEPSSAATTVGTSSMLKTLFATKLNALVTASLITASALGGYGIKSAITPTATPTTITGAQMQHRTEQQTTPTERPVDNIVTATTPASLESAPVKTTQHSALKKNQTKTPTITEPINVGGNGQINIGVAKIK